MHRDLRDSALGLDAFKRLDGWSWYALALAVGLQTSTALTSILAVLGLSWVLTHPGDCLTAWRKHWDEPIFRAMAFMLAVILVGVPIALWRGYAPWAMLSKHLPLLFFFLILGLFEQPERRWAVLVGFGLGALLALSTSLFSAATGIAIHNVNLASHDYNTFRNHTEQNIFMALPAFALATLLFRNGGKPRLAWLGWLLVWLATFDILHLVRGRTGQIVFAPFLLWIVVDALRRRRFWIAAATCLVVVLSVLPDLPGHQSAIVTGIQMARQGLTNYRAGRITNNSTGERIDYFGVTVHLIQRHPILGYGTGGFAPAYAEYVRAHGPAQGLTRNPHDDYLFYWTENGLPGLLAVVSLYLAMAYSAWRKRGLHGLWLGALALAWAVPSLANSVLLDHASSFVFVTLLAALCAGPPPFSTDQTT